MNFKIVENSPRWGIKNKLPHNLVQFAVLSSDIEVKLGGALRSIKQGCVCELILLLHLTKVTTIAETLCVI